VLALALTLVLAAAASAGSISFDHHVSKNVRLSYLPPNARWIDQAGVGAALLVQTPATLHARAHEQLFWNRTLKDVVFFDQASPIDAFGARRLTTAPDGRLLLGGKTVRSPLAISNYAVRMRLRDARVVARGADYELWRPLATPRAAMFVGGLYYDRWLAQAGRLTLWPASGEQVRGTLRLRLSLPHGTQRTVLQLRAPGVDRDIVVLPRRTVPVMLRVDGRGPWTLRFRTKRPGYLGDGRVISVKAEMPTFTRR
jgi:hypothetical protein